MEIEMTQAHAKVGFEWDDPLLLDQQLSSEERQVRDAARTYCQERLAPPVLDAFRHERTDPLIFRGMGELGLLGITLPQAYRGADLGYVSYGFVARGGGRVGSADPPVLGVQ